MYVIMYIRVGGVSPTHGSSFLNVVLVGVALFFVCISLHPLIFMYVHMLMCVCVHVSICLFVCVWGGCIVCACVCASANVRVSSDSQSTGLKSTSLTCQIRAKVVV